MERGNLIGFGEHMILVVYYVGYKLDYQLLGVNSTFNYKESMPKIWV